MKSCSEVCQASLTSPQRSAAVSRSVSCSDVCQASLTAPQRSAAVSQVAGLSCKATPCLCSAGAPDTSFGSQWWCTLAPLDTLCSWGAAAWFHVAAWTLGDAAYDGPWGRPSVRPSECAVERCKHWHTNEAKTSCAAWVAAQACTMLRGTP